jgi:hypothetical protein
MTPRSGYASAKLRCMTHVEQHSASEGQAALPAMTKSPRRNSAAPLPFR